MQNSTTRVAHPPMQNKSSIVKQTTFPDPFASNGEKNTIEYGRQVGLAIQFEWWGGNNSSMFYSRWQDFARKRAYASGNQPIQQYKDRLAIDGDLSHVNLDWRPVPIMPKFIDIVVNGMSERLFKVNCYSQDAMSQDKRNRYQDMIEAQMAGRPLLEMAQRRTGMNMFAGNPEELPQNDEELELYMQLNYKPAIEIANETAINTLLDENKYEDLRYRLDRDQATIGVSFGKHTFDTSQGVTIDYVDPANVVWSHTVDPFFKDCFYFGEAKIVHVGELKKINPKLTAPELEVIRKGGQGWYDYIRTWAWQQAGLYQDQTVSLLYFNYKTTRKEVYKKKILKGGGMRITQKDESFNPPEEMMTREGFEKIERTIDVWYEGVMVMGSGQILKWEVMQNMARPKSTSQHPIPQYIGCAALMDNTGFIDSMARRMISAADQIQLAHLKLQQVTARLIPDGVFLDADGLNEIDLGNGQAYNPTEALRMYFQTGSVIGRSKTGDGEFNHGKIPIQELTTSSGHNKMLALITNYNHHLDMIREATGLNKAADASSPDSNALVGVQKLAALNSNVATRHILHAGRYIFRTFAEAMSYRVADILQYATFKEDFISKIGRYNTSILNETKDLYLYDFAVFIEITPDEQERAQLEGNIQMALSKGDINLEDAIDVRTIRNIKVANQLLKVKRKRNIDRMQKDAMQQQAMLAQQTLQSQELAAQLALAKIQAEAELDGVKADNKMRVITHERAEKQILMREEFQYGIQLQGLVEGNIDKRDTMKEDRKDRRTELQANQQSELINQRQNNLPPKRFESINDTFDGIQP